MKTQTVTIDLRYRSLLQKAVRRGADNLVITTCALLESLGPKAKNWVRKRAAVITFEECWPLGEDLVFNKSYAGKVAMLVKVTRSVKDKDSAGLGGLAHALAGGDRSVLDGFIPDQNRDIRVVASAVKRPEDFWRWAADQAAEPGRRTLIQHAARSRNMGMPVEKACTQAAAYLAASGPLPRVQPSDARTLAFPYEVVFDIHTRQGSQALHDIARDLHMTVDQLSWAQFFFEGGVTDRSGPSSWWERYARWRFRRVGVPMEEAHLLWGPAKQQLTDILKEDSHRLHATIYRWKMAHLEPVDALKHKVERFIANFKSYQKQQQMLF